MATRSGVNALRRSGAPNGWCDSRSWCRLALTKASSSTPGWPLSAQRAPPLAPRTETASSWFQRSRPPCASMVVSSRSLISPPVSGLHSAFRNALTRSTASSGCSWEAAGRSSSCSSEVAVPLVELLGGGHFRVAVCEHRVEVGGSGPHRLGHPWRRQSELSLTDRLVGYAEFGQGDAEIAAGGRL